MFKYFDEGGGVYVYWEPEDEELARQCTIDIVGKAKNEVTKNEAMKVMELYESKVPSPPEEPNEENKTIEELKAELEEFKIQSALAQAEAYEKQEQDKLFVMEAIAEAYELGLSGGIE